MDTQQKTVICLGCLKPKEETGLIIELPGSANGGICQHCVRQCVGLIATKIKEQRAGGRPVLILINTPVKEAA